MSTKKGIYSIFNTMDIMQLIKSEYGCKCRKLATNSNCLRGRNLVDREVEDLLFTINPFVTFKFWICTHIALLLKIKNFKFIKEFRQFSLIL